MNHGGDAAEQIVRMSLEGVEVAAKIAGAGAKNIAAFLYAMFTDKNKKSPHLKLMGQERMKKMLKSGMPVDTFVLKESDLQKFSEESKRYGLLYAVGRNTKDGQDGYCVVMVKQDDSPRVNKIIEQLGFADVDRATIKSEILKSKSDKTGDKQAPEKDVPDKNEQDKLLDELFSKPQQKEAAVQNPEVARTEKSRPSEPISRNASKSAASISERQRGDEGERTSVRAELNGIKTDRKQEADTPARDTRQRATKPKHAKKRNKFKKER